LLSRRIPTLLLSLSFFNDPAPSVISTLSLHDALPIYLDFTVVAVQHAQVEDQQGQHDDEKAQPEPGGSSQEGGCQKVERMHRSGPPASDCRKQLTPTSRWGNPPPEGPGSHCAQ